MIWIMKLEVIRNIIIEALNESSNFDSDGLVSVTNMEWPEGIYKITDTERNSLHNLDSRHYMAVFLDPRI